MTPGPRTGPRPVFRLPWRSARQIRSDFEDEISFHCEMRVAELVGRGMSERDARVQVASEAGDLADAKRYVNATDAATERAHLRRMSMQHITQEIGQAVRRLRHERAFALTAVSTLALGLGACMLMFNIVDAVLLSPLPFRQPDRVVMIWQYVPSLGAGDALQPIGGRQLAIMRENLPSFESIAGFRARPMRSKPRATFLQRSVSGLSSDTSSHELTKSPQAHAPRCFPTRCGAAGSARTRTSLGASSR
jgi:hypothetical protein